MATQVNTNPAQESNAPFAASFISSLPQFKGFIIFFSSVFIPIPPIFQAP